MRIVDALSPGPEWVYSHTERDGDTTRWFYEKRGTPTMENVVLPAQVENEIMRLSDLLEKVTTEHAERARHAAETDVAYDLAYARARLQQKDGTVADRDAHATLMCEDALLAKRMAEARYKAAQEAGRNYRAQLDALRSINANVRYQAGLG